MRVWRGGCPVHRTKNISDFELILVIYKRNHRNGLSLFYKCIFHVEEAKVNKIKLKVEALVVTGI